MLLRPHQKSALTKSIVACIANAERLLDEAMRLEFEKPPATKLVLSMIAQEEYAKAFLLFMVQGDVIPWTNSLARAMNDHRCKQLIGVIFEYIHVEWENIEDIEAFIKQEASSLDRLPHDVASAINLLRYEKMGRWEANNWVWTEPLDYEPSVVDISEGKKDQIKQNALYVRLGKNGQLVSTPNKTNPDDCEKEYERAHSYRLFVKSLINEGKSNSSRYTKVYKALKTIFQKEQAT